MMLRDHHRSLLRPSLGDDPDTAGYLRRLGVEAEPPSIDALFRIHRAHVERVPYETFWIHLGEGWGIDPLESFARLARSRRGGYCFHVNGALAHLLTTLGYEVTMHVAGVHDSSTARRDDLGNHVALLVHGLASDQSPTGCWYVDVGLGDVLFEPIPSLPCVRHQVPTSFRFGPAVDDVGTWRLTTDGGPVSAVSIDATPTSMATFLARHDHNRHSPTSSFARTVTAQRRHATGADVLRGLVLTRTHGTASTSVTFERRAEWLSVLADVFDLRLEVAGDRVDALWRSVDAAHQRWLAGTAVAA